MRPRYVIVVLAIVVAAAVVALGPLRGRSVKDGLVGADGFVGQQECLLFG
jgi:hypothetical protein